MKHIIWDFNGTLLNDTQLSLDVDNNVFEKLGIPAITIDDYRNNMTMPVRDFYPTVGVDYSVHSYETIARLWLDEFNQKAVGVGLVSGALDAIRFFHGQGRSQSVLSASYEPSLRKQCEALGLTPYMADISGLEDESASKKTEIGRRQLRELGLEGRDVVLIGDMLTDAHLAEDLGADCILVSWGHNDLKRLLSSGLPVARDFGELEEILKGY
ncbi:MAG: HAD hydrolase-like protein [Christensenellales bacterium]|nr:HAD hydrolase-like protein [Christensenellales bacterium]